MDVFSLGCVMHYCLTGGQHPFGGGYERDTNILRGAPDLSALAAAPEAANLIGAMLSKSPTARPSMAGVLAHPFWWGVERRLQFLVDVSDRWGAVGRCQCARPSQMILIDTRAAALQIRSCCTWQVRCFLCRLLCESVLPALSITPQGGV
jgi:serine/threonine protein kinase